MNQVKVAMYALAFITLVSACQVAFNVGKSFGRREKEVVGE